MARSALRVFADLAEEARPARSDGLDVIDRSSEWQWEGFRHLNNFIPDDIKQSLLDPNASGFTNWPNSQWWPQPSPQPVRDGKQAKRLAALDQLRSRQQILRLGWMWLAGVPQTGPLQGRTICLPILIRVVTLARAAMGSRTPRAEGDIFANVLIEDPELVGELVAEPQFGGGALNNHAAPELVRRLSKMTAWTVRSATAIGVGIDEWLPPSADPRSRRAKSGVAAIPGTGLFVDPEARRLSRAQTLTEWMVQPGLDGTAFGAIYGDRGDGDDGIINVGQNGARLHGTRRLDVDQETIVVASRSSSVLGVVGPPGTGKTHTLCEVALDAIGNGQSVLVGANSEHAVSVIARQLAEVNGPVPVLFGGSRTGRELSVQLIDLLTAASGGSKEAVQEDAERTAAEYAEHAHHLSLLLDAESMAARMRRDPVYRLAVQDRFDSIEPHLDAATRSIGRSGLLGSFPPVRFFRMSRAARAVGVQSDELTAVVDEAERYRLASRLASGDSLPLSGSLAELLRLEGAVLAANATRLAQLTLERLGQSRSGRRVVNEVSTAMRAGRSRRRELLGQLDGGTLAESAPLWLGTVTDIDDVLPAKAAMFDLVILDEASQMDQISSAGALLRASRAVVCGDPRQLRHVSFVSDAAVDEANAVRASAGQFRIDLRRQSTLDQAVAAGRAVALRTHYRSSPHLISFSARQFYDGALELATTNPANDGTDLIDVRVVDGTRTDDKINQVEIDAVLRELGRPTGLAGAPVSSIGIITPFRAQADALVDTMLARFDADELERRAIEVGTVHAFQGAEFDLVIASWCLGPDASSRSWAFVNDPNLFNVMISRARRKLVVITSMASPPGLAGEFLVHADQPPRPKGRRPASGWPLELANALSDAGFDVDPDYRVGAFSVDLALRNVPTPTAVICEPHPDGAEAHLERDQLLRHLGWELHHAFESRWMDEPARFAIELRRPE